MNKIGVFAIISLIFIMFGCGDKTAPKPIAYPYIENGVTEYAPHNATSFPLQFDIANNTTTQSDDKNNRWINILYPQYNATIYCTYINTNKETLQQDLAKNRELVYVHSKLSSGITSLNYNDSINNIWGELYILKGNVATPLQFIATNNSSYIFRGSLYFNTQVDNDSVAPIVEYIQSDMARIIESIETK